MKHLGVMSDVLQLHICSHLCMLACAAHMLRRYA